MKSLPWILIALVVIALFAAVILVIRKRRSRAKASEGAWPFYVRRPLSQPEQVLYHRLIRALPNHIVLAQVQVSRILGVKKGANFREWSNKIDRLSDDFVVCGKDSGVLAVIELDDRSHESKSRASVDERKNKATVDAGLRVIRWHVGSLPDEETIRTQLAVLPAIERRHSRSGAPAGSSAA